MVFYLNYLPSDVVENMLVIFYGSLNSLETILSISNDISNQDALYSFNSKKNQIGNNYFSPQITKFDSVS